MRGRGIAMKYAALLLAACLAVVAQAQQAPAIPMGQGAGVHSPNSPFAPLPGRNDVVPWSLLTSVATKNDKNRILPVFGKEQLALDKRKQRVQGFMMPLEPG